MNVPADRVPESASHALEPVSRADIPPADGETLERARQINARRALVEDPEMLRRLRSL